MSSILFNHFLRWPAVKIDHCFWPCRTAIHRPAWWLSPCIISFQYNEVFFRRRKTAVPLNLRGRIPLGQENRVSRHPVYISIWDVAPVVEGFRSRSSLYPNPPRPLARSFWSWRRQYRQHMIRATIHKARTPKNTPTIKIVLSLPSWFTIKLSLTSVNPAWIEKLKSLALKSTRGWFTCVIVSTYFWWQAWGFWKWHVFEMTT